MVTCLEGTYPSDMHLLVRVSNDSAGGDNSLTLHESKDHVSSAPLKFQDVSLFTINESNSFAQLELL